MKNLLATFLAVAWSLFSFGFSLPTISDGTKPGEWTRNITGVLAEAKTTGYPIFLAVINDSNSGEGCSHCKSFLQNNVAGIEQLAKQYQFYMVILNYWSGAQGYSKLASTYRIDYDGVQILPSVQVRDSSGKVQKLWNYRLADYNIVNRIGAEIEKLTIPQVSFSLATTQSTSIAMGSTWSGKVVRSGKGTAGGTVSLSLSGTRASQYTITPKELVWNGTGGEKSFTISGPAIDGINLADAIKVIANTSGFAGNKVVFEPRELEISFKDMRVLKTLEEFRKTIKGISSATGTPVWYVPSDASAQLVCGTLAAGGTGTVTFNFDKNGTLSLAGKIPTDTSLAVNGISLGTEISQINITRGDSIQIQVTSLRSLEAGEVGLTTFTFEPRNEKPEFPTDMQLSSQMYKKVNTEMSFKADSSTMVTYKARGLPSGMSINKNTGKLYGTASRAGNYQVTITAQNEFGESSVQVALVVSSLPTTIKGSFAGVLFDGEQKMVGSVTWKVASSGKLQATVIRGGVKMKYSGLVVSDINGNISFSDREFSLSQVPESTVWVGKCGSLLVYGKIIAKNSGVKYSGVWNMGLEAEPAGYLTAKITDKGAVTIGGKISGKTKLSAKAQLIVLDAAFVAEHLPALNYGGDVAIAYGWKKSSGRIFDGGLVFRNDNHMFGEFTFANVVYADNLGVKWNPVESFFIADGMTVFAGDIASFPIKAMSAKKIAADTNSIKAKISASQKTGIFKGSFKNDSKTLKYEGVFMRDGEVFYGVGGGLNEKSPFTVAVEIPN